MRLIHTVATRPPLAYVFLGTVPYGIALNLQHQLVQRRLEALQANQPSSDPLRGVSDVVLLLEHTPVFTSGRRIKGTEDVERKRLGAFGADYFEVPVSSTQKHDQNRRLTSLRCKEAVRRHIMDQDRWWDTQYCT